MWALQVLALYRRDLDYRRSSRPELADAQRNAASGWSGSSVRRDGVDAGGKLAALGPRCRLGADARRTTAGAPTYAGADGLSRLLAAERDPRPPAAADGRRPRPSSTPAPSPPCRRGAALVNAVAVATWSRRT